MTADTGPLACRAPACLAIGLPSHPTWPGTRTASPCRAQGAQVARGESVGPGKMGLGA